MVQLKVQLLLAEPSLSWLARGLPVLSVSLHEPLRVPTDAVGGFTPSLLEVSPRHSLPGLLLFHSDLPHTLRLIHRRDRSTRTQDGQGNDHGSLVCRE